MDTLRIKGAYTMIRAMMKRGDKCIKNDYLNTIILQYYKVLSKSDLKDSTIEQKLYPVLLLFRYILTSNKELQTTTIEDVLEFSNICSSHNWAITGQTRVRAYIKSFLNWAFNEHLIRFTGDQVFLNIIWHKKTAIRSFYTTDEIQRFLNRFDTSTAKGKEEYLIMCFIIYLGLRIGDVINIKITDIDWKYNLLSINQVKTQNPLTLPLVDEILYPLVDYMKNVRPIDCEIEYVFVTYEKPYRHKKELNNHYQIPSQHLKKANIDVHNRKRRFHAFRHSFSTRMLEADISVYCITTMLGHTSIGSTTAYLDIDIKRLKELSLDVPYVK